MSEVNYRQQWAEGEIEAGTLLDAIDDLAAKFNDPEYPPKHSRRLIEQLRGERDAALAELAALKGGREAVATKWGHGVQGVPPYGFTCHADRRDQWIAEGKEVYAMETAPPAQASAWVPEGLVRKVVTDALIGMVSGVSGMSPPPNEPPPQFIQAAIDRAVDRIIAALAAAPTPGDSDGKGEA